VQRGGATATTDIAVAIPGSGKHTILIRGVSARYAASGHLLYVTDKGALMAAPFDQQRLTLTGAAVPILQGLPAPGAFAESDLTVSSEGTLWYATGQNRLTVEPVWVSRNGAAAVVQPGWKGDFQFPELSRDGTRMAFSIAESNGIRLWIKRLDRGTETIFAREGGVNFRPAWSSDGRSLAYISDRGPNYDILVQPADQSTQPRLLLGRDSEMPIWEVAFPRTGPWVLFRTENRGSDLYAIRPGVDSAPVPLVVTDANERFPALSPDGRWLAYVSNVSGRQEVYVRPFPKVTEAMWQVSTTGGTEVRWAHSGRELFFRNEAGELVAVSVTAGASFEWGEPRALFSMKGYRTASNGRMWDVAPGDQRFLMLRPIAGNTPSELIVVENFFQELKALAPR
jgi:serine/threonine-protein kinase